MRTLIDIVSTLSNELGQIEEQAKEQFGFSDLSLTQLHYLETINIIDNPNLTELSERLSLSKATVTVMIDRLILKGYVIKVHSDQDRRTTHLHLSQKGKLINQMHQYAHSSFAERIQGKLTDEELLKFVELTSKILF